MLVFEKETRRTETAKTSASRAWSIAAILVGCLGMLTAILVPLAPVWAKDTTVTWPSHGSAPASTTAFFVPYRPAELHVSVPCRAIAAADRTGKNTVVFATARHDTSRTAIIRVADGTTSVLVEGRRVASAPADLARPGTADCGVRLDGAGAGLNIRVGGRLTNLPGHPVPQVFAFVTDLPAASATGMTVRARTQNWFESSPTTAKLALIGAYLLLAALSLGLLAAAPGRVRRARRRFPSWRRLLAAGGHRGWKRAALVDGGVIAAFLAWWMIGPVIVDEGFYGMIIRNGLASGEIANYIRWQNASEAPFNVLEHLLSPFYLISFNDVVVRLPSIVAGIALWFVLTRAVLGAVLGDEARTTRVRLLAAVALLAWWLPWGPGVRPEPFVALGATGVFALLLRASRSESGKGPLLIGTAALVAGVTSGMSDAAPMMVAAPVIVLAPRLWRKLRGTLTGPAVAGVFATAGCLGLGLLVAVFADETLSGGIMATELHTYYGPALGWYEEFTRYQGLTESTPWRQVPVFSGIVLALVAGALVVRGFRGRIPDAHLIIGCFAVALPALALTPSKWTHHFGSLAGFGAALVVVATLVIWRAAKAADTDLTVRWIGLVGLVASAIAAGLSFSGRNRLISYSALGMPWRHDPVPVLSNPPAWLAAALIGVGVVTALRRSPGTVPAKRIAVRALGASPVWVLVSALAASVLLFFTAAGWAPIREGRTGFSAQSAGFFTGHKCGVADKTTVLDDVPDGALRPATVPGPGDRGTGFAPKSGWDHAPPSSAYSWGSRDGAAGHTGHLTTRWFRVPHLDNHRQIGIWAAGRLTGGNRLTMEFGRTGPSGVRILASRHLRDRPSPVKRPVVSDPEHFNPPDRIDAPYWRTITVPAANVPSGAGLVRLTATDATTDPDGWLAFTGPRQLTGVTLTDYLRGKTRLLLTTEQAAYLPCLKNIIKIRNGLAQAPKTFIGDTTTYSGGSFELGGSMAGLDDVSTRRTVPTVLPDPGWGAGDPNGYLHLYRVHYRMQRDAYDVSTRSVRRHGW